MSAKLILDLKKCEECQKCDSQVECSYKHHPDNRGIDALLEKIRFALICRKCEAAPCVKACPRQALEKVPTKEGSESPLTRQMDCGSTQKVTRAAAGRYAELPPRKTFA